MYRYVRPDPPGVFLPVRAGTLYCLDPRVNVKRRRPVSPQPDGKQTLSNNTERAWKPARVLPTQYITVGNAS